MAFKDKIFSIHKTHDERHTELCFCGLKLSIKNKQKVITISDLEKLRIKYKEIEKSIAEKTKNGKKIKVAFFVHLASMFPAKALMDKMLTNENFNVSLIVLPDFRFGEELVKENMEKTIEELSAYKNIMKIVPYDNSEDNINLKEIADIVFPALPYDVSHSKYNLNRLIDSNILTGLVNYAFYRSKYDRGLIAEARTSMYWKIFIETELNLQEYKNFEMIKGDNIVLTGYSKMDGFKVKADKSDRKTIMIAPHHSVEGGFNDTLGLSNFYKYADLFIKLPDMYPNINFIFRPHPALFMLLANKKYWGQEKVDEYLNKITSKKNVEYSQKGDYFSDFSRSDGIINDCGSYLVEYFYTKKPHCYMLKSAEDITEKFTPLGQQCLENCYIAYEEKNIIDFIDNVIINENDTKKEQREKFANDVVMYNYPNASEKIIEHFSSIFRCNKQK